MNRINVGSISYFLKHEKLSKKAWILKDMDMSAEDSQGLNEYAIQKHGMSYDNLINKWDHKIDKEDENGYENDCTVCSEPD